MRRCALVVLGVLAVGLLTGARPRLRIVGTAQDGGVPHVACRCDTCENARHLDPPRFVSSVAILPGGDHGGVYLIDATPDITEQLVMLRDVRNAPEGRVDRAPLDGIFLTHAHLGHYTGLAKLGFEAVGALAIPVHASPSMAGFLRTNGPWSQLVALKNIELQEFADATRVPLPGGIIVTPIAVPHRDEYSKTHGFVVSGSDRSALFVPDTDAWDLWDPTLEEVLETYAVDLALLDATFYSLAELPGRSLEDIPHPLITGTMDRLQSRVDAGLQVWFIHLNHSNPALDAGSEAADTIAARGFRVAREGDEFDL